MSLLEDVIRVAREAGAIVKRHYDAAAESGIEVVKKADDSPLTIADRESNAHIVERLAALTPDIPIVAEESERAPYEERKTWRRFWLVDPLDGTKEFIKRNGEFTVNIGLIDDGEPVLGVMQIPATGVVYAAEKGQGAWRHDPGAEPVRITSHVPDLSKPLVAVMSRSHQADDVDSLPPGVTIREARSVGSALKFCLIAEGLADVYVRAVPTMEWDVAAGDCIWRNSASEGQRASPIVYNKESLTNGPFVIGLD